MTSSPDQIRSLKDENIFDALNLEEKHCKSKHLLFNFHIFVAKDIWFLIGVENTYWRIFGVF